MIKEEWIKFKEYIMENDGAKISDCIIGRLLEQVNYIKMFPEDTKLIFYRARIGRFSNADKSQMMNPPSDKATAGRCNKEGISYLYMSKTQDTAIREIIKSSDEEIVDVTIAEFSVDMSNVFSFLPYKFNYMKSYIANAEINELLKIINEEMMRVITDTKEYIPLQYIAEYIKSIGYDGFLYGSVVGEGMNLVMFNNVKCSMKNREEKQININNWLK